jgi:hypothetical protein
MISKPRLSIELIPKTCHYSNIRTTLTNIQWDKIRKLSYKNANNQCEICGDVGKNQGYKHNLECHEIWEYDDIRHIQKLIGLISLCVRCHHVKHIGRTKAIGKYQEAIDHLRLVNNWSIIQVNDHISESFIKYKERSNYEWSLDLSILENEPYLIKLKQTTKRIFKIKKYKKKTKKKIINKRPKKK